MPLRNPLHETILRPVSRRRGSTARRPAVDCLEARCLLSYTVTDLGTLGGPFSEGRGLNASGDVAGLAQTGPFPHPYHAFRYQAGAITDLDTHGSTFSSGDAIN